MIRINANLFRIAMLAASSDETRHYLKGVFVEPHAVQGVTLTATNGHQAVSIYDADGHADECAIVQLTPGALKACKPGRNERRDIVVKDGAATVNVTVKEFEGVDAKGKPCGREILIDTPVAFSQSCVVDSTYPDYRRIFPGPAEFSVGSRSPAFSTIVMTALAKIAAELSAHHGINSKGGIFQANGADSSFACLITFPEGYNAIAVAMPMRSSCANARPSWFDVVAPLAQAAE